MAANKDSSSEGFATALQLWLFFLFSFLFLGYPVELSILLGAIGGATGGFIVSWWNSKDASAPSTPVEDDQEQQEERSSSSMSGLRLAKQRRDAKKLRRSRSLATTFSSLLKR
ncbi:MAG: hypothetical protein F6K36_09965 [Symploca sp. SIO3C6]|uniref:Uncharacterized protein n=1 Tax=Symploca sp. SIO1C4 TaxID=2607765 RepID=A0A6B3N9I8_9CYAN|nr:hypothetical protein [Symploca sp. SIO3C6]NER26281.1 hypothetical protein [Symploca sp. SIO1C4]NET06298.1 hypothetical protein [Symploca sp. SIO2B6]NET52645.1 hypothetical protein [Merismopedia sp. SIO2A8]